MDLITRRSESADKETPPLEKPLVRSGSRSTNGWGRRAAIASAYLTAYVLLDWASYVYPVAPLGITPWNPPPGLSLALLLAGGLAWWPMLPIAALAADVIVRGVPANPAPLVASAAIIACGYTAAAAALRTRMSSAAALESTRDLARFLLVATCASGFVATAFVGFFWLTGMLRTSDVALNVLRYWVGDLNGILVLTPTLWCVRSWRRRAARTLSPGAAIEIGLQAVSIVLGLGAVFALSSDYPYRSFYVLFLPLIWIAARWGLPGAALALSAIQIGLIGGVQLADYHSATFVQLQMLMTGMCVTGLTLGATASYRARLERELHEKQLSLARAQQLASAGELTSALAHQLNQPITALNAYLGACALLSAESPIDTGRLRAVTAKASAEARKAGEVVGRLRDFYQRGARRPQTVQVADLIASVARLLRAEAAKRGVELVVRSETDGLALSVDRIQVENALQNLVQNAIDAAATCVAGEPRVTLTLRAGAGRARIEVADNGPGVDAEMASTLFEPFATSKADGMGMGLAIARSLARGNGGDVELSGTGPGGSVFVLLLDGDGRRVRT